MPHEHPHEHTTWAGKLDVLLRAIHQIRSWSLQKLDKGLLKAFFRHTAKQRSEQLKEAGLQELSLVIKDCMTYRLTLVKKTLFIGTM